MDATCGYCGKPADVTIQLHLDADSGTFPTCRAHIIDTLTTIAATVDLLDEHPFDKAIAHLTRKQRDGTANDNDLADLNRYRRLRAEAVTRHPSSHTPI
jgi:hypothetical protein